MQMWRPGAVTTVSVNKVGVIEKWDGVSQTDSAR